MMDKFFLFRTLIVSMMICLLIFDVLRIVSHSADAFPEQHKEPLLTGTLLWIVSVIVNRGSNDDDWAGEI